MEKKGLCVFAILIVFLFSGCASLKCLDGSCERQIKELTVTNDDLKKETARLDAENKEKEKTILADRDEIARLKGEKATLSALVKDLDGEVQKVKKEREEKAAAIKNETIAEKQKAEGAAVGAKESAAPAALKIKVLAGDGKLASARKMAREIEKSGLKVEIVDLAPRANFAAHTVYYTSDAEKEAKDIAKIIGENAVLKRMTWSSAFQIIVVTGKK